MFSTSQNSNSKFLSYCSTLTTRLSVSTCLGQVHFNENQSQYVKLEVSVTSGPSLQCIEGYGTTPSSGSHMFHFLKPCQVSGLLRLTKGAELRAKTAPNLILKNNGKHYFGLFKIN